jgi:Cu(I)/Ag(I) efflux system protein CusF
MRKTVTCLAILALATALPAIAAENAAHGHTMMHHGTSDRGSMMHVSSNAGATGQAIINSVDAENKAVNLTHGPIPELSWPEMTMDLPVASGVALNEVEPGDAVLFKVVLGDDQVYRITEIDVMP